MTLARSMALPAELVWPVTNVVLSQSIMFFSPGLEGVQVVSVESAIHSRVSADSAKITLAKSNCGR